MERWHFGNSGEENLPLNRKNTSAGSRLREGQQPVRLVGVRGGKQVKDMLKRARDE